jgi:hypothetical protein
MRPALSSIGTGTCLGSPTRVNEAASSRSRCAAWLPGAGEKSAILSVSPVIPTRRYLRREGRADRVTASADH